MNLLSLISVVGLTGLQPIQSPKDSINQLTYDDNTMTISLTVDDCAYYRFPNFASYLLDNHYSNMSYVTITSNGKTYNSNQRANSLVGWTYASNDNIRFYYSTSGRFGFFYYTNIYSPILYDFDMVVSDIDTYNGMKEAFLLDTGGTTPEPPSTSDIYNVTEDYIYILFDDDLDSYTFTIGNQSITLRKWLAITIAIVVIILLVIILALIVRWIVRLFVNCFNRI